MRLLPVYETMVEFSCTLTVEVWSGVPPPHPSGPSKRPLSSPLSSPDDKVVRILLNGIPYRDAETKTVTVTPQESNEITLAEFSEQEIRDLLVFIGTNFEKLAASAPTIATREGQEDDD
jgi:hypothetical protein